MFVRPTNPVSHRLARMAFIMACVAALVVASAGPLHRYAGLDVEADFAVFRYGFYFAVAAVALGLATIVPTRPGDRRRGFVAALLAIVIGAAAAYMPLDWFLRAQRSPEINDISTDIANPPPLVVTLQLRRGAPNPAGLSRRQRRRAAARRLSRHRAGHPAGAAGRGLQARRRRGDGDGLGHRRARAGRGAHRGRRHQRLVRLSRRHRGAHPCPTARAAGSTSAPRAASANPISASTRGASASSSRG